MVLEKTLESPSDCKEIKPVNSKRNQPKIFIGRTDAKSETPIPWPVGRSNQSILKEINPEYALEGLMLIAKLQYFGHMMQRSDSLEKTLMLER